MDIVKIIKSCFRAKEDIAYSKQMKYIDKRIEELKADRAKLAKTCIHPRKYLKVHNDGWDIPDGWGGSDYSGDKYRGECTLCGSRNVGTFEVVSEHGKKRCKGHPLIISAYKIEVAKEQRRRARASKKFEKERELRKLEELKAKYEV